MPQSSPPADRLRRLGWLRRSAMRAAYAADPLGSCGVSPSDLRFWRVPSRYYRFADALVLDCDNLIPLAGSPAALTAAGIALARSRPPAPSVYGRAEWVLPLWQGLATRWPQPRQLRPDQHFLRCDRAEGARTSVRLLERADVAEYLPAAAQMFAEEIGIDPLATEPAQFIRRSRYLLGRRRVYGAFDSAGLVFKAEVAGLNHHAALIQGVWVRPEARGQGLSAPAMAALVDRLSARWAVPSVLYVNSYNAPALACYRRCGFRRIGTFATVLR